MPQKSKTQTRQQWGRVQKLTIFTGVVVIVLVILAVAYQQWNLNSSSGPNSGEKVGSDFRLDKQPALGANSAKVKVVEFGDYKCPVCQRFEEEVFPRLKEEYIDTGKIEFFFVNFQFIAPDSTTAGIAGECVYHQNKEAFWGFHEAVYKNQGPESQTWATPATLLRLAREYAPGIDYQALEACVGKRQYEADVKEDEQIGNRAGVNSTPTIFVNGKKVQNWSYENLKTVIERELAQ